MIVGRSLGFNPWSDLDLPVNLPVQVRQLPFGVQAVPGQFGWMDTGSSSDDEDGDHPAGNASGSDSDDEFDSRLPFRIDDVPLEVNYIAEVNRERERRAREVAAVPETDEDPRLADLVSQRWRCLAEGIITPVAIGGMEPGASESDDGEAAEILRPVRHPADL